MCNRLRVVVQLLRVIFSVILILYVERRECIRLEDVRIQ